MKMTPNADGTFTIAPGLYALTASQENFHPDDDELYIHADEHDDQALTHLDHFVEEFGVEMLAVGTGTDRRGAEWRTVSVGDYAVLVGPGSGLVLTPVESIEQPSTDWDDDHAYLQVSEDSVVSLVDGMLTIGALVVDLKRPGSFRSSNDGIVLDLSDDRIADAIGHGADADFNEHGMRVSAEDADLAALRATGDETATRFADELEREEHLLLYFHRPTAKTPPACVEAEPAFA